MKTLIGIMAASALAAVMLATASAQNNPNANPAPAPTNPQGTAPAVTPPQTAPAAQAPAGQQPAAPSNPGSAIPSAASLPTPPATPVADGEKGLRLNFRGAPLEMVLNYLSDAAGFIIVLEARPEGKVDVWSNQPLTKDEAVDLLNTILNKNNLAAIRNGRTLTIVSREEAKKRNIPVKKGADSELIPKTEEMVTQVIPVKHANVAQLTANLQTLLGTYAEMTANESANSLVITATQADVRRMTEIINALDESISSTSDLKVFPLRYADAKELADVIKELFAPTTQQGNRGGGGFGGFGGRGGGGFGGFGGFGGPGGGGPGGGGGGGGNRGAGGTANTANMRVVAVADQRSNSLVVGAPEDLMNEISNVIAKIDQPVSDITELRVFHLMNADPTEMADMFAQLFPDDTRSNDQNQNQMGFRFGGGFGFGRGGGPGGGGGNRAATGATAAESDRMKKKGRVLAVADQRTSSLIVSAASEMMPQIAEMVLQLDSSPARKQRVFVYNLDNADVQQVEQILKGMFERTTTSQNNRNNQNQNSALTTRAAQNQNNGSLSGTANRNSGFGNSGLGNSGGFGGAGGTLR
jgi:type II secretory pathway component GspD/PulD (secretin)